MDNQAKSDLNLNRYQFQTIQQSASGNFISTFSNYAPADFQRPDDIFIKIGYGQRIDQIAYDYLGDGGYWWVICLTNGFSTPFDPEIVVGKVIRIPSSVSYVLSVLESKKS